MSDLLEMRKISKTFPGVKALDGVDLRLKAGEIHALLGENGAGKSTLIKVLGGIYKADGGQIFINGQEVAIHTVSDAQAQGIAIIHQELVLAPDMTIAENIFLGREPKKRGFVDCRKLYADTQRELDKIGLDMNARTLVRYLPIAQQQMVEITKAVSYNSKILVMDEPTSSISDKEVEFLFGVMRRLAAEGVGIIYISHKMSELKQVCDRVTVMRDGQVIDTKDVRGTSNDELINLMVGRSLTRYYTRSERTPGEVRLRCENLSDGKAVRDVTFEVRRGEIVGFAGLIGAGRSETMHCVLGLSPIKNGKIYLDAREIKINNPRDAIRHGIGLVPEDRKKQGLYLQQSVRFNMTIEVLQKFIRGIFVDKKKERAITQQYIDLIRTKTPSQTQAVSKLSGGNQQKVLIGRWLATHPEILVLDEPTRGIDVGAKSEIYATIDELANQGISIIMISSELPEIINMCDRVYIMRDGRISGSLDKEEFSQEKIMQAAAR